MRDGVEMNNGERERPRIKRINKVMSNREKELAGEEINALRGISVSAVDTS